MTSSHSLLASFYRKWRSQNKKIAIILLVLLFLAGILISHIPLNYPKWVNYFFVLCSIPWFVVLVVFIDIERYHFLLTVISFIYYIFLGGFVFTYFVFWFEKFSSWEQASANYLHILLTIYFTVYAFALPCIYLCMINKEKAELLMSIYKGIITILSIIAAITVAWIALFYVDTSPEKLVQFRAIVVVQLGIIGGINILLIITDFIMKGYHYMQDK